MKLSTALEAKDRLGSLASLLTSPALFDPRRRERIELDIVIGFFLLRKLIESCQVTRKTTKHRMKLARCEFTRLLETEINTKSKYRVYRGDEIVESRDEMPATMKPYDVANMFIHSYYCCLTGEDGGRVEVLVISDKGFLRTLNALRDGSDAACAYIVPTSEIAEVFDIATFDRPLTPTDEALSLLGLPRMIGRERRPALSPELLKAREDRARHRDSD